jgi:hypothetical protein
MAVYDEPTIIQFTTLESEWKMASVSFIETRRFTWPHLGCQSWRFTRADSNGAGDRTSGASDRLSAIGTTSRAGLRAFHERR